MPDIIATKGGATSNCYASLDEAETYFDEMYGGDEWLGLSEDDQARLLLSATKQIDRFTMQYEKASATQALKFPVSHTTDGFAAAKEACILQAFFLLKNNDAIQEGLNVVIQGVKSESLSSVSRAVTGYNPFRRLHPEALRLLGEYLDMEFKIYRG
jgi:hypothetical protein